MNKETLAGLHKVLLQREKEIVESIAALPDDMHQRDDHVGDSIDKSVAQFDHASASSLRERQNVVLTDVRDALERIRDDEFGVCEGCEDEIPEKRLIASPLARFCVQCQEEAELDRANEPKPKRSFFDT